MSSDYFFFVIFNNQQVPGLNPTSAKTRLSRKNAFLDTVVLSEDNVG